MLYFLLYDDETNNYKPYIDKMIESIYIYGIKDTYKIIIFKKSDIDSEFINKHVNILNYNKGGGYWLWKSYIIYTTLNKLNDDDILFYLDSKYYFIEEFTGLYKDKLQMNNIIVWKNKPNEPFYYLKNWCKMDVILKYNMYDKIFLENAGDCWAGAIVMKKNTDIVNIIKEWLDMCSVYENITDSPSNIENSHHFIEHRHDQCLLSIVLHKHNIQTHHFEKKYLQNARVPY